MMLLVLVFSSIFLTIIASMISRVVVESSVQIEKMHKSQALSIAEAGLEYYKWFLAHNPGDIQNGTGHAGPYVMAYSDPESGDTGSFSLDISGNQFCGNTSSIEINSTGWSADDPATKATIYGKYAQPSVAEFSYLINDSVWAGSDRNITGRYHSNGGIRMDGTSNSKVTSSEESWYCDSSFGCSPATNKPGVWGTGSDQSLWEYPVADFDFGGITQDISSLKTYAQSDGLYFGSQGGATNANRGYKVRLNNDGTMTVWRVRRTRSVRGYNSETGWNNDYYIIRTTRLLGTYSIPSGCPVAFFEDRVWLSGDVHGKLTVVAADIDSPGYDPNILISNDIQYGVHDGTDGLTAIAEGNILVTPDSEDNLTLEGIFVAQNGHFGRNLYDCRTGSYSQKNNLSILGSIVSFGRVGTQWSYYDYWCGGSTYSGYANRTNSYDRSLMTDPPPFTPAVSPDYKFVEWREET